MREAEKRTSNAAATRWDEEEDEEEGKVLNLHELLVRFSNPLYYTALMCNQERKGWKQIKYR